MAMSYHPAVAQINNASDWNVPPPLPPGSAAKAVTNAKTATLILSLIDIPAGALPVVRAAQVPTLAPVSITSPSVSTPDQPAEPVVLNGIAEIPHPGAPDAPPLPKQTMQDVMISPVVDLPFTAAPEMPPLPAEPKPSGQIPQSQKAATLLLPYMPGSATPKLPVNKPIIMWPTPAIIQNESLKSGPASGKKN